MRKREGRKLRFEGREMRIKTRDGDSGADERDELKRNRPVSEEGASNRFGLDATERINKLFIIIFNNRFLLFRSTSSHNKQRV